MRTSVLGLFTLKETPAEAELASHRLMLRAGMIRSVAAGIYTWLPLGLRVLRRVEEAVREEMNRAGAVELLMPAIQPAELWQESNRWTKYGPELLRLTDRHHRLFCFGPTHEEVITDLARREIRSYRELPLTFYQIQTKFRDEIRPRFGVMRAREFVMKDAYSFHVSESSLQEGYDRMHDAYHRIFRRLGLEARAVAADSGAIGGRYSHEFHVLADAGEDQLALSDTGPYAANVELAEARPPEGLRAPARRPLEKIRVSPRSSRQSTSTGGEAQIRIELVKSPAGDFHAIALCAGHTLNPVKVAHVLGYAEPVSPTEWNERHPLDANSLGPLDLPCPLVADHAAAHLADFSAWANAPDELWQGVNWGRDCPEPPAHDLRVVTNGDPSPDGVGRLRLVRGIEVGHIFQLGTEYSERLHAYFQDESGGEKPLWMGCYGVGVSRIVAAAIEQHHDEWGISWPMPLAPFAVAIAPIGGKTSSRVWETACTLEAELESKGCQTLLDDRDLRPGSMFADLDLIGIPQRLVVSERGLAEDRVEWRDRKSRTTQLLTLQDACTTVLDRMRNFS